MGFCGTFWQSITWIALPQIERPRLTAYVIKP
jgi:hypothetical protein